MNAEVTEWSVLPEPWSSPFFSGWGQLMTILNPSRSSGSTLTLRGHRATTASTTSSSLGHNPMTKSGPRAPVKHVYGTQEATRGGNEIWRKGQAGIREFLCENHPEPSSIPTQDGRAEHSEGQWSKSCKVT